MNKETIITATVAYVQQELADAEGGHDWWHIQRVWVNAKAIAATEEADLFIVELGALLHDIADSKFHGGDEEIGPGKAGTFLSGLGVEASVVRAVEQIIRHISFKGGHADKSFSSPELNIVQDADRLDAIGAIGIARAFHYGGFKHREIYNPGIAPDPGMDKETYKKSSAPTINHFYEKLLLLKDLMNTRSGKKMAAERDAFMQAYLQQFYAEWDGEK